MSCYYQIFVIQDNSVQQTGFDAIQQRFEILYAIIEDAGIDQVDGAFATFKLRVVNVIIIVLLFDVPIVVTVLNKIDIRWN